MQTFGKTDGVGDGLWEIAKEFGHGGGIFEMTFAICSEQFADGIEMGVVANAGEDIEHLPTAWFGVKDAVGGEQGQVELFGKFGTDAEPAIFAAKMVALNFDEDIGVAKSVDEAM